MVAVAAPRGRASPLAKQVLRLYRGLFPLVSGAEMVLLRPTSARPALKHRKHDLLLREVPSARRGKRCLALIRTKEGRKHYAVPALLSPRGAAGPGRAALRSKFYARVRSSIFWESLGADLR